MKLLLQVASSPNLEDSSVTDLLFATESWQTLMTFARELDSREFIHRMCALQADQCPVIAAQPSGPAPTSQPGHTMDEDIPPELYEQFAREAAGGSGGGAAAGNIRICPHCTFENTHTGSDCEVCGLPL